MARKARTGSIIELSKTRPGELHLGGAAPGVDLAPGEYLAKCVNAWIERLGQQWRAVWQFHLYEGKHHGTALRKWKMIADQSGEISRTGEYARCCEIALGRPLGDDIDVTDPAAIFAGKIFTVFVGYRKTERPRGGKPGDDNAMRQKDQNDRLRVHNILARVDL
jgi:hypothetical protein